MSEYLENFVDKFCQMPRLINGVEIGYRIIWLLLQFLAIAVNVCD